MKARAVYVGILLFIIFVLSSLAQHDDFPVLKGPYLGQKPPGMIPEIFAPGIISTENFGEAGGAFTENGTIFLFNRRTPPESHKKSRLMTRTEASHAPFEGAICKGFHLDD